MTILVVKPLVAAMLLLALFAGELSMVADFIGSDAFLQAGLRGCAYKAEDRHER